MSHTLVYIESLTVCILFLVALFIMNIRRGAQDHFKHLAAIYLLTIVSALLDILWILVDGQPQLKLMAYFIHPIYLSSFILISGIWFSYCCKYFPGCFLQKKWQKALVYSPLVTIVLINISSVFTGWTFYLDEQARYCRGPLYSILLISYIYLLTATILALRAAHNAQLASEKKRFGFLAAFGLSPIALGVLSVIAPPGSLPTMQYSILFSLLLIFVNYQDSKITNDSLTGLNNRYSLDATINEHINRYRRTGETFFILLADLNSFKGINDTYGHMEGDRMLKVVANILDSIAKDYGSQASRMGGDEFAMVVSACSLGTMQEMKHRILFALEKVGREECRDLSVSIGIAQYENHMTIIQFLDLADQNLYLEKNGL